ncbi:hypothetical protein D3C80_1650590 [compost metagenome]
MIIAQHIGERLLLLIRKRLVYRGCDILESFNRLVKGMDRDTETVCKLLTAIGAAC